MFRHGIPKVPTAFFICAEYSYYVIFSIFPLFIINFHILPPLNAVVPSGIATVAERPVRQPGIYSPSGIVRRQLQRGLNIIVSDDGRVRKVIVR